MMTAAEMLAEEAKKLPESIAREMLDFVFFLKERKPLVPNEDTVAALQDESPGEVVTIEQLREELL